MHHQNVSEISCYQAMRTIYERYFDLNSSFRLVKGDFFVGQKKINLADKPVTLNLVRIFLSKPGFKVTKREILENLYGDDFYERYSARFVEGKEHNIVKLITRARKNFKTHFWDAKPDAQWFHYNLMTEEWVLLY